MHEQAKTYDHIWLGLAIVIGSSLAIMVQHGLSARNLIAIEMFSGVGIALIIFLYQKWLKQRMEAFWKSLGTFAHERL